MLVGVSLDRCDPAQESVMAEQEMQRLAAEAWVYGYPLVANLEQVVRFTTEGAQHEPGGAVQRVLARRPARRS